MAKFIRCSCEETEYRGNKIHNNPINIEFVTQVKKIQQRYYPDNEGTPAIEFSGIDTKWVYSKNQLKQRDIDYENIVLNRF